jgi:hypothetical protein
MRNCQDNGIFHPQYDKRLKLYATFLPSTDSAKGLSRPPAHWHEQENCPPAQSLEQNTRPRKMRPESEGDHQNITAANDS